MSFAEYAAQGWKLCGIDPGKKAPTYDDWNIKPLPAEALEGLDGAGLLHQLSGTAALDVDDMARAKPWLAERGVDIDALLSAPTAVRISSGRHNRAKLLYRLKLPMRTLKPKGSGVELRCATADGLSVQDVLPPTVHPGTKKPYEWQYGDPLVAHWSSLPPMPASLLALWRNLLAEIPADRPAAQPATATSIESVRKAIYRHIEQNKLDVSDHEDWLSVGMRLNEQTGGDGAGLDIWDEWSATDKSLRKNGAPRYEGKQAIELRYRSMHPGRAGNVGMAGAIAQLPSEAEDFEVEQPEDEVENTATKLKQKSAEVKAEAVAKLEKRLVFVYNAEKYFDTQRRRVINTEAGLQHMFTPMMPRGKGGGRLNPVNVLKESSTKRYVDAVGFHPGEGAVFKDREDYSYANTYDSARIPKDIEPTAEEVEKIEWIFGRIDDNIFRAWLKQFYAHVVQRPGIKIKSAPLIWSETQGNGKTTLVRQIPSLLVGGRYSKEITYTQLEDNFTGYLLDTWHVNLTEFRAASRNQREAVSKKVESWIADDFVTVRPMQQVAYTMPNHFFVTGSSNFDDAASISGQDRKWAIHELRAEQFSELEQEWIYNDFLLLPRAAGVLRAYFKGVDITGFTASAKAIQTDARRDMIQASTSSDTEALELAFEERSGPFARDVVLTGEVSEYLKKVSAFRPSFHRIGKVLAKAPFKGAAKHFRSGAGTFRGFVVRNHAKWAGASGKDTMDHIQGVTENISIDFDDETVDLLA